MKTHWWTAGSPWFLLVLALSAVAVAGAVSGAAAAAPDKPFLALTPIFVRARMVRVTVVDPPARIFHPQRTPFLVSPTTHEERHWEISGRLRNDSRQTEAADSLGLSLSEATVLVKVLRRPDPKVVPQRAPQELGPQFAMTLRKPMPAAQEVAFVWRVDADLYTKLDKWIRDRDYVEVKVLSAKVQ
jgi:hypothetical protein